MGEGDRTFGYVGALDGVRALAVAAVLLFHADVGAAGGGFLGVSVFFTLSGFLITSLLIAEHRSTGTIGLRGFYLRRARRLLPAAYLCIAGVLLLGPWWVATQRLELPGDVVAAVANVANWRFAFAERTYQELFLGAPSPLAHFWSLAIEEQCYLVLPLVVAWALRRGGMRRLAVVLGGLTMASLGATLLTSDLDLVYNGTHTRAAELLVGALAAMVLQRRSFGPRGSAAVAAIGIAGLGVLVAVVDLQSRWLYRGGFVLVAIVSACTVVALVSSHPVARLLGSRPFVAVGRRSYGVYLYHWPVFLLLTPDRTGLAPWPLLLVRLTVTATMVVLSYRLLEMPIRRGRVLVGPRAVGAAFGVSAVALVSAAAVVVPAPDFSETESLLALGSAPVVTFTAPVSAAGPTTTVAAPVVLVLGSSDAPVSPLRAAGVRVIDGAQSGCPIASGVEVRHRDGTVVSTVWCEPTVDRWRRLLAAVEPDLVVVSASEVDAGLVRTDDDAPLPGPGDVAATFSLLTGAEQRMRDALAVVDTAAVPAVYVDDAAPGAPGERMFARLAIESSPPRPVQPDMAALVAAVSARLDGVAFADRGSVRVLVVGDSTSLNLAKALNDGADGRLVVQWAGANGCPLARVEATRPSPDSDWVPAACPDFAVSLPPLLADLRPDVVLVVLGPTELQEQRYPGDPGSHVAGDTGFVAFHDAEFAAFLDVVGDVPVMVADAPPIEAGHWASATMAAPARLAQWNEQVARWVASRDTVSSFPYAAALAAHEAVHGSIRIDGVHPDVGPLTDIARAVLVPAVVAAASR